MNPLICLIGESGAGKSTIEKILVDKYNLIPTLSYTTRARRNEEDNTHTFVTDEDFPKTDLVAYSEFDNHKYGVTKEMLDKNDIFVVDVVGVNKLMQLYQERPLLLFYLSASERTRRARMRERGDSEDKIAARLENDAKLFAGIKYLNVIEIKVDNISPEDIAKQIISERRKFICCQNS